MGVNDKHYSWTDFLAACEVGVKQVFVIKGAMETAATDFKLHTMTDVVAFCANGLENLKFINCKDWENNPNKSMPVKVDAYHFSAGRIYGYIAFFKTEKWIIKSFKKESQDPRNLAFGGLQDLVDQKKGKSDE